ncbi:L-seryl-tRNA(Sec) selenium transferase [Vallitalea longa]|uniref:L-seryl-tRNA(Sec) selenium transferase n=1 Tax=Vallitalea longa TaxID=2936439 RepID=A0A9W5YEK3_9FIRM|nr:L-seryl-tRNA(Sec) selenium transferase [Vallitalea longa]GKX31241.1 L-seryl-tRNA(Sec) selenium transferase [Vallitalea longa]
MINDMLRKIPSTNEILEDVKIKELVNDKGRNAVKDIIVNITNELRIRMIEENDNNPNKINEKDIYNFVIDEVENRSINNERKEIKKVINATGIILHTNMGRSPLPKRAVDKIKDVTSGYCNLEYDLFTGERGSRYEYIEKLITRLTGAESAFVVNNNAAAVFLCINTLANNKEVIVSRSEQVEIGGSFRIPEIVQRSGARMVEIGTTNKTYISDYNNAISDDTRILLKVHKSNYKIQGFTSEVTGEELVSLAKDNDIITMEDLGSGVLLDLQDYYMPYEPTVMDQVKKGIDIITFSGDKLLGGPQAGIIVGKKELIEKIKVNPLTRMVRIDKMSLIALQEVLKIYIENEDVKKNIPIIDMLTKTTDGLAEEANNLKTLIKNEVNDNINIDIIEGEDVPGGGSLPGVVIKGISLAITIDKISPNELQNRLRNYSIPIICKIKNDRLMLNMRTIDRKDYKSIADALKSIVDNDYI